MGHRSELLKKLHSSGGGINSKINYTNPYVLCDN